MSLKRVREIFVWATVALVHSLPSVAPFWLGFQEAALQFQNYLHPPSLARRPRDKSLRCTLRPKPCSRLTSHLGRTSHGWARDVPFGRL
jgi:hypothetical protein